MKKLLFILLILIPNITLAADITNNSIYTIDNVNTNKIQDNKESTYITINKGTNIKITSTEDIYGLYIIYERASSKGSITNIDKSNVIGENDFLHEYINVQEKIGVNKEVNINYENDVKIADIYVLGNGELPSYVEVWHNPVNEADLLLFSTHSDDEQLFFLGLLPTYVARGASVQVVYFTNHYDNPKRLHEQLHGLYTVGITNYPIIGIIPDAYSESLEGALKNINKANLTEDDALKFEVAMLRRFKPQVVVGHDEKGEYSHGQHILNTYILKMAIEKANNPEYDTDSFNKYGLWDTPKVYLHLYKENPIVMNYDIPLDYFDGKTAYEVSKEGYSKHLSQQWTWFTAWINGKNNEYTKATDIKTYSPTEFGLYRSLVGEDINKNDMLENITLRKDIIIKDDDNISDNKDINDNKNNNNNNFNFLYLIIPIIICIPIILIIIKRNKD